MITSNRFFKITLLAVLTAALALPVMASAKICLNTSSFNRMFGTSLRNEFLLRAHEIALKSEGIIDYATYATQNDTDLVESIKESLRNKCDIIIGLYTSRECLLVGPMVKATNTLVISPTCGHNSIEAFHPNIVTGVPSIEEYATAISGHLNTSNNPRIYVFHQPTDVFSQISLKAFKEKYKGKIDVISVGHDGSINDQNKKTLLSLKSLNSDDIYVVFLMYPVPSASVLAQMSAVGLLNANLRLVGSSSWAFDSSAFGAIRDKIKTPQSILVPDILSEDKIVGSDFYRLYKKQYNTDPIGIQYMSYDVTRMAAKCFKTIGKYSLRKFRSCLTSISYIGSSGIIRFTANSPFAIRPIFFSNFLERIKN